MTDKVQVSGAPPGTPGKPAEGEQPHQFGLTAAMALIVGLFYISSANFHPWNVSGESTISAIGGGMAIALFSYLGVETAAVAAAKVRNPDRNILGANGPTVFTTLVLMTGITSAIPYAFSALAQLKWRWIDHRTLQTPRLARDMIVAALALVFSILFIVYSRNTGHSFWVTREA